MPNGNVVAFLEGLERFRLVELVGLKPFLRARVEPVAETVSGTEAEREALRLTALDLFREVVSKSPQLSDEVVNMAAAIAEPGRVADFIAGSLPGMPTRVRQELLETFDIEQRLKRLIQELTREREILSLRAKIQEQVEEQVGKVEESGMPPEARLECERELKRLAKMTPASAEYMVARTYLEWMTSLPWNKTSGSEEIDVNRARAILDEDHYDLEKVKERILDYLAVRKLQPSAKGPILCFLGPPGVGKTSLGRSIARALGRKFVRISLG